MAIYAIGDLHLSHNQKKPMDVFGDRWHNHVDKLALNWDKIVSDQDLVIVAGDISWGMNLEEAGPDIAWLNERKGKKLLIRGNHDYWWSSISKVRAVLPSSVHALQNDHFNFGSWTICGTRGWLCPGEDGFDSEHDQKIYLRELRRLELSLESAKNEGAEKIIVALHYPPFSRKGWESDYTELMENNCQVKICVFGHIHDEGRSQIFKGCKRGINYIFVAADGIDFKPFLLKDG